MGRSMSRHCRVILVLASMWLARAGQIWAAPERTLPEWSLLHNLVPVWLRVGLWAVTALAAIILAMRGRHRGAYVALSLMPAERAFSYVWSALMWVIPGHPVGYGPSVLWATWWAGTTVLLVIVAGWPDHEHADNPTHTDSRTGAG